MYLTSGEYSDRFEIRFATENLTPEDPEEIEENNNVGVIYSNDNELIIINNPDLTLVESIEVYNILGQSVMSFQSKSSDSYIEHIAKNIKTSIYIIRLKTEKGYTSKKVLIR